MPPTRAAILHVRAGVQGTEVDPGFSLAHNLLVPRNWLVETTALQSFALLGSCCPTQQPLATMAI